MELIYPSFYHKFRCIAGACPDSCCHEWEVQVDAESAARYRAMPGPLGDALRESLYDEDAETYLRNRDDRCPMWRQDGLCRIQAEQGHDALCQVCQQFPRLTHDYGDFMELGLEMSCPEAARMILSDPDYGICVESAPGGEEPEYDALDMEILRATREEAVNIILDRSMAVEEALAALLIYGYEAQEMLDSGEMTTLPAREALAIARAEARPADPEALLTFFRGLEILTDRWKTLLDEGPFIHPWTEEDRAFARYLVERYWLQAISDLDLCSRVRFIIASCLMVSLIPARVPDGAQLYSKEIENNSENVARILDESYYEPVLYHRQLLGLLLY